MIRYLVLAASFVLVVLWLYGIGNVLVAICRFLIALS